MATILAVLEVLTGRRGAYGLAMDGVVGAMAVVKLELFAVASLIDD